MASRYNMDAKAFEQTIKATVMPAGATNEQMAAFLLVANQYDLNPVTKEIYAFPSRGGGVTPVVGIDGWINLAQRRHEFDGLEFEYDNEGGEPKSCSCRIYRKDRGRPIVVTEYMDECRRPTDPWKSHPRRMLRHKAAIQAIRYAFGFSGIKDEDDAEVIYADAVVVEDGPSQASAAIMGKARETSATATLSADDEPTNTEVKGQESQWPRKNAGGAWIDSREIAFMPGIHSMGANGVPSVRADGTFRMRRGCNAQLHADMEKAALDAIADKGRDEEPEQIKRTETEEKAPAQQETATSSATVSYPDVRQAIARAATEGACGEIENMIGAFGGQENHREELRQLLEQRRKRIASLSE